MKAGLVYAVSTFGTFPDGPDLSTATAPQIRDHVAANSTTIRADALVGMIAVAAATVFFAALTRQVRDRLDVAWEDGGDPTVILCTAKQKKAIDAFAGVATRFVDVDRAAQASIVGAANLYVNGSVTLQ